MEPKKDRLEEYFRKSLDSLGDQSSPGGWDLPSDQVWKGIESSIPALAAAGTKAIIIKYAIYTAVSAAAGFAGVQMYNQAQEVRELKQEIRLKDEVIAELNLSLLKEQERIEQGESLPPVNSTETSPDEDKTATILDALIDQNPKTPPVILDSKDKDLIRPNSLKGGAEEYPVQTILKNDASIVVAEVDFPEQQFRMVSPALLQSKTIAFSPQTVVPALTYSWSLTKPIFSGYKNPATLGVFVSPAYSYRSLYHKKREVSTPYEKTETPELSYIAGINFGIPVGRNLSIGSGVHFSNFHQRSQHTIGMRFTVVGGTKDAMGNHVNNYRTRLETSFGLVEVESRVSSDSKSLSTAVNEGRVFPIRYNTDLRLKQLTTPLLLQYHIGNERIGLMLKGGLAGTFILNKGLDISQVQTLNRDMVHLKTDVLDNKILSGTKDFTLDLYASAGLRASLTPSLDFIVEPSFRKNITPVFEDSMLETRMFSLSIQSGLTLKF